MQHVFSYTCAHCGQQHDAWPGLAYASPTYFHQLSQEEKETNAEINSDLCIIRHPEQTDRFIRGTLTLNVLDHCDDLEYGLWVSVSEQSFQDYANNFHNDAHQTWYFGWISNDLCGYEQTTGIPATVAVRANGQRPEIVPHVEHNHPLVRDYYEGITRDEADRRIRAMLEDQ